MIPRDPVPMELWGKDHWSTLGYIETRCVDHGGEVENDRMRTDSDRYPALVGPRVAMLGPSRKKYPTQLAGGKKLKNHDDWDCAADMEAAGLLKWEGTGLRPVFVLTKKGLQVSAQLREHKAGGGCFATFSAQGD